MSSDQSSQPPSSSIVTTSIASTALVQVSEPTSYYTTLQSAYPLQDHYAYLPNSTRNQQQDYINQFPTATMMSHRDLGYGYMPQALPVYSAAQSYHSTLAPLPGYYPDLSRHLSTSPSQSYLPTPSYPRYQISSEDREQIQKRRRRNSTDRRHQVKMLSRKANAMPSTTTSPADSIPPPRLPNIMGSGLEESPIQASPIDMFSQAPMAAPAYVADTYPRAASYERSPSIGHDYRPTTLNTGYNMTTSSMSSPSSYHTAYTMASMGPSMSSLAPPSLIPSPSSSHHHTYPGTARSSPMLMPTSTGSMPTHIEPVILDNRRDKPQCWDHGCNGREFSTFSNLLRHQREKSGSAAKAYCPRCGAEFTRTTARNGHMEHGKCKGRRASTAGVLTVPTGTQSGSVSSHNTVQ